MNYLGGMFFSPGGTNLYIVRYAEDVGSYVAKVPVLRDSLSGRITGLGDPPAATGVYENVYARDYLDVGFREGPGGRLYYSTLDFVTQASVTWGGPDGEDAFITELYDDSIAVLGSEYAYSVAFNAITGNMLVGTEGGTVFEETAVLDPALDAYVATTTGTIFMNTTLDYVSDLNFVPSGSLKNSIVTSKYLDNAGDVLLFAIDSATGDPIDDATGLPLKGTANPRSTTLFSGINQAWGIVFDPVTVRRY